MDIEIEIASREMLMTTSDESGIGQTPPGTVMELRQPTPGPGKKRRNKREE